MAATRANVFSATQVNKVLFKLLLLLLLFGDIELCPGPEENLMALCKQKGFKLVHQNIRGLLSNMAYFESLLSCTDIIGLSEHILLTTTTQIMMVYIVYKDISF